MTDNLQDQPQIWPLLPLQSILQVEAFASIWPPLTSESAPLIPDQLNSHFNTSISLGSTYRSKLAYTAASARAKPPSKQYVPQASSAVFSTSAKYAPKHDKSDKLTDGICGRRSTHKHFE